MKSVIVPNFIIVGAAKCGTTALAQYLSAHPDVFMPHRKEPTFFCAGYVAGGIRDRRSYLELFAAGRGHGAVGEASTAYLADPGAADHIKSFLGPEVRIVVMLRDPVRMAYSLWQHQVRLGLEDLSFEDAIAAEPARAADPGFAQTCPGWSGNFFYTARADYAPQLRRYLDVFPAETVKVFIFEEFFRPGLPQWDDLCAHIGIDPGPRPEARKANEGGVPRSRLLFRLLFSEGPAKSVAKLLLPDPLRARIGYGLSYWNSKPAPPGQRISEAMAVRLNERFRPSVRALEQMLGRDLSPFWPSAREGAEPASD